MDPDSWNWDLTEEGTTNGSPGAVIEVHFTRDEFLALSRLAQQTGVGPVEYTRQTMLRHIAAPNDHEELKPRRLAWGIGTTCCCNSQSQART